MILYVFSKKTTHAAHRKKKRRRSHWANKEKKKKIFVVLYPKIIIKNVKIEHKMCRCGERGIQ